MTLIKENSYDPVLMDEFGNFHFGMVAAARGYSLSYTLMGAGVYQAFRQGGGSREGAIIGGVVWASQYVPPNLYGVSPGANRFISSSLTNAGFSWGDNPGDSSNIMKGWAYGHDR
jgi:hypothetical protein